MQFLHIICSFCATWTKTWPKWTILISDWLIYLHIKNSSQKQLGQMDYYLIWSISVMSCIKWHFVLIGLKIQLPHMILVSVWAKNINFLTAWPNERIFYRKYLVRPFSNVAYFILIGQKNGSHDTFKNAKWNNIWRQKTSMEDSF